MKKLLIAMSAAAMFSLCAKAESTTLLGGMNFETGYSAGDPIATTSKDPGSDSDLIFWAGDNGESLIAVEGEGSTANKYLKVDTTAPLVRQTTADASKIDPVSITNADVIVSARVQFTAADEAPEPADGDKLVVWMRAAAEAEGTQGEEGYTPAVSAAVMVTDKTGVHVLTNIADEAVESFTADWHTLAIKAVKAGTEQQPTASFTVTLDGTDYGPYKSLVTGGGNSQTIASIGFKGTGAVDDIVFTKNAAEVAEKFTVTVSAPGKVGTDYGMGDDLVGLAEFDVGTTEVEIYVLATADKTITCNISGATIGATPDSDGFRTVTIPTASVAANATVEVTITVTAGGGTDVPEIVVPEGGTVAGVIAAATSATGIPLANVTDAAQVVIDNDNHTVKVGDAVPVSIAAFYTATLAQDMKSITLTLNDAALTTAGNLVEVSVDTTFGLKVSASNTKLYYGLSSSATVNGTYVAPAKAGFTQGTGSALTLSAAKGVGSACFYKLYVTDVLPNE